MHGRKQFLHLKYLHFSLLVCIFIKQTLLGSKITSSERKQRIKSTDIMNKQQCQHTQMPEQSLKSLIPIFMRHQQAFLFCEAFAFSHTRRNIKDETRLE